MQSEVEKAIDELRAYVRVGDASTIFVAVNNDVSQAKICRELMRDGHHVSRMINCIELLEQMANDWIEKKERRTPDLIIVDMAMKGNRGIDLLVNLRQAGISTPFILLAEKREDKLASAAARFSGVFVFKHPFDMDDLKTAILLLLDKQQRREKCRQFNTGVEEKFDIYSRVQGGSSVAEKLIDAVYLPGSRTVSNGAPEKNTPERKPGRAHSTVERRVARRIPLEISVEEKIGRKDYLLRKGLNISTGGILYQQKYPQRKDAIVNLEFMVPGLERPVQVSGKILHLSVKENMFGMGARFLNLPGWARDGIENLIHRSC